MGNKQLKKIRRVAYGDVILPTDDSDQIDNWRTQSEINDELKFDDPELEDLLKQLKAVISQMYYVQYGDFVRSELHNLFVDAWNLQQEINQLLYYWKQQATKSIAQVKVTFHGRVWNYVYGRVLAPDPAQNTLRLIPFAKHSISASAILMQTLLLKASASVSASAYVSKFTKVKIGGTASGKVYLSQVFVKKASILISANVSINVVK